MTYSPTYADLITRVRDMIDDADDRIAEAPHPFTATWWPTEMSFEQEFLSDHGIPSDDPDIEEEFYEELKAIGAALADLRIEPTKADWQRGNEYDSDKLMMSLNARAMTMDCWERIGRPIRRSGNTVVRISAPRDVMGSPYISTIPIDYYLNGVAERTADDMVEIARLTRILGRWRAAAIVLAVVVAPFLVLSVI